MIGAKWANIEDEGAVHALLQRLVTQLPVDTLDALWIFPTRRAASVESTVIVASCRDADPDRRRIFTARFMVQRDRKGRAQVEDQLLEHATAPADAMTRVVDGVVRRLGDEAARPPRHEIIDADHARFDALIRDLGGTPPPPAREPGSSPPEEAE